MRENKYDGPVFFEKYSRTSRSTPMMLRRSARKQEP